MTTLTLCCPYCGSAVRQTKAGKTTCGSQRYHCHTCQRLYTPMPKEQGYPPDIRHLAIKLYLEGNSLRAIGRLLNVHPQTVVNWVTAYQSKLQEQTATMPLPETVETVELDALYTFLGAKKTD